MHQRPSNAIIISIALSLLFVTAVFTAQAKPNTVGKPTASVGRSWYDGTIETVPSDLGSLLTDNAGFYGKSILTGVTYTYAAENQPNDPADTLPAKTTFGRRLLDGKYSGDWYVPVGTVSKPIIVTFDFKRSCTFREVDISTASPNGYSLQDVQIETALDLAGPWIVAHQRENGSATAKALVRMPLTNPVSARYMRLTVGAKASGQQFLSEVWVWGTATVNGAYPEAINPLYKELPAGYYSIPGVSASKFTASQFNTWTKGLGLISQQAEVISRVSTWGNISGKSILPQPAAILNGKTIKLSTARNITEYVAVALTNTKLSNTNVKVSLSDFKLNGKVTPTVKGEIRVMGAIQTQPHGVQLTPMFTADNLLSSGLMKRYINNGVYISGFPNITLTPGGSAVLWISTHTLNAAPGIYTAKLSTSAGSSVSISVKVENITLPAPLVWLRTWTTSTPVQIPFNYSDRMNREVKYVSGLGITVWNGFPSAGNDVALARKMGNTISSIFGVTHWEKGYPGGWQSSSITPSDKDDIAKFIKATVAQAKAAGLSYNEWQVELWDEPGTKNGLSFGALARVIKEIDPNVNIYCDPCSWTGTGWASDSTAYGAYGSWYNDCIDISVPAEGMDNSATYPQEWTLWSKPRFIRAFYDHPTEKKSESNVELVRKQAWKAFNRGWNGWGTYSYCSPNNTDPWNDMDDVEGDHLMAYPGPNGPVATRRSEGIRAGWEDYCLLSLMRDRGLKSQLNIVLARYQKGTPMQTLRQQMIGYLK